MGAKFLVGVAINLVGSILINLGTNVMKLGHNKRAALPGPDASKPPISRFREWQVGVAAFAVGNVANFASFGYAAQSLLSAIGCVQFVSNVVFARFVLKERVTPSILIATACIVAGCVLLVSFGDHTSSVFTARDLRAFYSQPVYVSYMAVSGAAVVACYMLYHLGKRSLDAAAAASAPPPAAWSSALPVLYSTFSALIGTQSVLFSKTIAVLLRATADGDNQFKGWFIYVMLPCFLIAAIFWMTRLNKGLKMFSAMVIVPTLQIAWTLFSILSGMLYFKEYRDFTPMAASFFVIGLLVMFTGVFLLTRCAAPPQTSRGAAVQPEAGSLLRGGSKAAAYQREDFEFELGGGGGGGGLNRAAAQLPAAGVASVAEEEGEGAGLLGAGAVDSSGGVPEASTLTRRTTAAALRRVVSSLRRRMGEDWDLDEASAAKLALGLGDGDLPAMSIFGPPVIDIGGGAAGGGAAGGAPAGVEMAGGKGWRQRRGGGGGAGIKAFRPAAGAVGDEAAGGGGQGERQEREPLPAEHLLRSAAASGGGGINPLANAISVTTPRAAAAARPPSPFADFAKGVEQRARSIKTAVSAELRATAAQLRAAAAGGERDRGYSRTDAALLEAPSDGGGYYWGDGAAPGEGTARLLGADWDEGGGGGSGGGGGARLTAPEL